MEETCCSVTLGVLTVLSHLEQSGDGVADVTSRVRTEIEPKRSLGIAVLH
jgi:hypothetical protein